MEPLPQTNLPQPVTEVPVIPPVSEPPVPISEPPKQPSNIRKIWIPVIIITALVGISALIYFVFTFIKPQLTLNVPKPVSSTFTVPQKWINCGDVRQVVDDGGSLYVACGGGVVIADKATGKVTDQIGEADGLSNRIATSLVKIGDNLYIGTQDGMTIFNLKTRQAQKISVKEGLPNGANVEVVGDGTNIWIATFNGVGLYDTVAGKLTSFTYSKLDPQAKAAEIYDMYVTEKFVYFLENSNDNSSGAVIQYEKSTGNIKTYKPDSFGVTGQFAYINITSIGSFGSKVFVSDDKTMFELDETAGGSWTQVDSPVAFIKNDLNSSFSVVKILKNTDPQGLLIIAGSKIYRYVPDSNSTDVAYDLGKVNLGILLNSTGRTDWFTSYDDPSVWVEAMDLDSTTLTQYKLADRPKDFDQVLAIIDDEPVIGSSLGFFKYSLDQNKFVAFNSLPAASGQSLGIAGLGSPAFQPIPNTQTVFIFHQICGQGCDKPGIILYNYSDGTSSNVDFPASMLSGISQPFGSTTVYIPLTLSWMDTAKGDIGMSYLSGQATKYFAYNISSKTWSTPAAIPAGAEKLDQTNGVFCNLVYTFKTNKNVFSDPGCNGVAQNGNLSWMITDGVVYETNSATGAKKALTPPAEAQYYDPFGNITTPMFQSLIFANGKLWIGSNRGLSSYNPADGTFKLYGADQGLLSKEITSFLIGKYIWAITNTGGLSVLTE